MNLNPHDNDSICIIHLNYNIGDGGGGGVVGGDGGGGGGGGDGE